MLKPFRGIRPRDELVSQVASPPYDVLNRAEALEMAGDHPLSFLHVIKSEIDLDSNLDPHDPLVYQTARKKLDQLITEDVLREDQKPCFYLYSQSWQGRTQTGLVGVASIDDYANNVIKKHELTREDKEQDRINHVDICEANTGPVFLTYKEDQKLSEFLSTWRENHPCRVEFRRSSGCNSGHNSDEVLHALWVIDEDEATAFIESAFKKISALYIADGHHRTAAAVKVGFLRRAQNPHYMGTEPFNYFLCALFPDTHLQILDYNRVVKDLNGLSEKAFLGVLDQTFIIQPELKTSGVHPRHRHEFGLYLKGRWFRLITRDDLIDESDPVKSLDVSILQEHVLASILAIKDPRTDHRIDFVGGIRGLKALMDRVDSGTWAAAFSLHPTGIQELLGVADAGQVMPPKSTWFEPKLCSGLIIHRLF